VLPESLHSDEVVARFRTAAIPVILMEGTLYKLLGMAGPTKGVDFGAVGKQKEIAVDEKAQDHPLAAGLRGTLEIATQPYRDHGRHLARPARPSADLRLREGSRDARAGSARAAHRLRSRRSPAHRIHRGGLAPPRRRRALGARPQVSAPEPLSKI
jgi:hypothetical protein